MDTVVYQHQDKGQMINFSKLWKTFLSAFQQPKLPIWVVRWLRVFRLVAPVLLVIIALINLLS